MPPDFLCEPEAESIIKQIETMNKDYKKYRELALQLGKKFKEQFSKVSIAQNILDIKK